MKVESARDEYFVVWDKNIEFDNFSNEEIAQAMTDLSGGRYIFKAEEIQECSERFNKAGDSLSKCYNAKLNFDLNKTLLLEKLFNIILIDRKAEYNEGEPKRKIIKNLLEIIKLASGNHPAVTKESWRKNQESGYFGNVL